MKILGLSIVLILIIGMPVIAQAKKLSGDVPQEYAGYMVYEGVNDKGEKVLFKRPVRYKLSDGNAAEDNDQGYEYRNYRTEMERRIKEQEAVKKDDCEEKRINSARYYPIYFDE